MISTKSLTFIYVSIFFGILLFSFIQQSSIESNHNDKQQQHQQDYPYYYQQTHQSFLNNPLYQRFGSPITLSCYNPKEAFYLYSAYLTVLFVMYVIILFCRNTSFSGEIPYSNSEDAEDSEDSEDAEDSEDSENAEDSEDAEENGWSEQEDIISDSIGSGSGSDDDNTKESEEGSASAKAATLESDKIKLD